MFCQKFKDNNGLFKFLLQRNTPNTPFKTLPCARLTRRVSESMYDWRLLKEALQENNFYALQALTYL